MKEIESDVALLAWVISRVAMKNRTTEICLSFSQKVSTENRTTEICLSSQKVSTAHCSLIDQEDESWPNPICWEKQWQIMASPASLSPDFATPKGTSSVGQGMPANKGKVGLSWAFGGPL